jgi:hypothetical protein
MLVRLQPHLAPRSSVAHPRNVDGHLLICEINGACLRAPAHDRRMRIVVRVASPGQRGHFLHERMLDGLEPQGDQRFDQGKHRRPVVERDRELGGDRRRHVGGWLALRSHAGYSWHGWCPRCDERKSLAGSTL